MDTLHSLIRSLSKEEIRSYKLYTQRYATGGQGLSVTLFDLMRGQAEDPDDQAIFDKIYGAQGDKNTFYRLKNRLQNDVCDALTLLHFDKHAANDLHRFMCIYNIFYAKGKYELAYYFIRQAEKKALASENLGLLDLIYADIVKLSNEIFSINPEEYVEKQSENAIKLNRMRQMDQVLAVLNHRIKVAQNFEKGNETLLRLVDKTIRDFSADKSLKESRSFQIKIYRAISQAMIHKMQYVSLEPFLLKTYKDFKEKDWFDQSTHDTRLQMLVYICNTLFKNRKFEEAISYAGTLGDEMRKYDGLYYEKYVFFYYNILANNYSQTNTNKALAALDEFEHVNKKSKSSYYEQFIHLHRAMFYFDLQKYGEAIRNLTRLYVNDHYKQADRAFKLKIEIAEVIMQYEAKDAETATKRIAQIKKAYKDMLKDDFFYADRMALDIVVSLIADEGKPSDKTAKKISNLIDEQINENDTHIIDYVCWLAPKIGLDPLKLAALQEIE